LEERLELQCIVDDILSKCVPGHVNLFYCFGGIVLVCFLLQVGSGLALTVYYRPTVVEAYMSVYYILLDVNSGWLIRSIHRCGSSLLVLFLILHISRVYLTAGFKKPRELTWITGVLLAIISVSYGVTGYSLVWDQLAYWACKIVTSVPEALDDIGGGIGKVLVRILRGGLSVSQITLTRFYCAHTLILPLVSLSLILLHFGMIRKQGISGPL